MQKELTNDEFKQLKKNAIRLWIEDDDFPQGAEDMCDASKRLFRDKNYEHFQVYQLDDCDTFYYVYESLCGYYIIKQVSYRGNNALYVSKFY